MRVADYERIVILSNEFYCEAANTLKESLFSLLDCSVMIVPERDYEIYLQAHRDDFLRTLFVGIAPGEDTYSLLSILDNVRSNGGHVVCFTDLNYIDARRYADIVISTSHPTFHSYLPISDFVIVILSLLSFGVILSAREEHVKKSEMNEMMKDIMDTASAIANSLCRIERQIAGCVSGIDNFEELRFVGSGVDHFAAYCSKYYAENYLGRADKLVSTENWVKNIGQTIAFVFITGSSPMHSSVVDSIAKHRNQGKISIITDDESPFSNENQCVIELPEVPDIMKPIMNIVVASLLIGKISEHL